VSLNRVSARSSFFLATATSDGSDRDDRDDR
jgi:hypothetical protein